MTIELARTSSSQTTTPRLVFTKIWVERRIIQALVLTTALKLPLMALNRVCTPLERPTSLSHANSVRSLAALF
jgi:hypothetical protein